MLQRRTPALAGTPHGTPHGTPAATPSRRPRLAGTPHGTPRDLSPRAHAAGVHPNGTPLNLSTKLMQVAEASSGDGGGGGGGGGGGAGASSGALTVDVRAAMVAMNGGVAYADADETSNRRAHDIYYTLVQAAMYILCFRALAVARTQGGTEFLRRCDWKRTLSSPLRPLRCVDADPPPTH